MRRIGVEVRGQEGTDLTEKIKCKDQKHHRRFTFHIHFLGKLLQHPPKQRNLSRKRKTHDAWHSPQNNVPRPQKASRPREQLT